MSRLTMNGDDDLDTIVRTVATGYLDRQLSTTDRSPAEVAPEYSRAVFDATTQVLSEHHQYLANYIEHLCTAQNLTDDAAYTQLGWDLYDTLQAARADVPTGLANRIARSAYPTAADLRFS